MSTRLLCSSLLLAGLAVGAARPAAAVSVVEPLAFGNWRIEPNTLSLGAGAAIGIMSFDFVPAFEYVFEDNTTDWAIDLDAHIPLMALPLVAFYAGGGMAYYSHDPDVGSSRTQTGIDLLVGTKMHVGRLLPFGEVRYSTAGPDGVALLLGTRFHIFHGESK